MEIQTKTDKYKTKGFTNIVTHLQFWNGEVDSILSKQPIPQLKVTKDNVCKDAGPMFYKSMWAQTFRTGGITEKNIIFGPERITEFRALRDTPLIKLLDDTTIIQGFPGIFNNWIRFTTWNEKRQDWGVWDLDENDTFGDILGTGDNYSFRVRQNNEPPTADHIAKAIEAGIMWGDYSLHGVFPRAGQSQPYMETHIAKHARAGSGENKYYHHCLSFYPPNGGTGFGAYENWHSLMKVKTADNGVLLGKRGGGKNYIIAMTPIDVMYPKEGTDGYVRKTLEAGLPYKLVHDGVQVCDDQKGYIMHVHEINTQ